MTSSDTPDNTPPPTTPGNASPQPSPSTPASAPTPSTEEGYYYLDEHRTSHGPYTLGTLQQMLADKLLQAHTLVSYKGAPQWWTLEQLCHGTVATPTGYATMPPPTSAAQYSDSLGLVGVFKHVFFHKYFTIKGRATRREFWMFILGYYLLMLILALIEGLLTQQSAFSNILSLFFIIPCITLYVRRLHDIGLSGWWYLVMCLACLPLLGMLTYFMVDFYSQLQATGMLTSDITEQEEINLIRTVVENYINDPASQTLIIGTLLSLLLTILANIAGFVCCVIDSQRGTNKYGPSYKYPDPQPEGTDTPANPT